ncbi:MAG TPA: hypothetical protein VH933_14635 [Aestuariivirgaceae bacterium]|jgi:hypothetical protein
MGKGIATAIFGFGVIMSVALLISEPTSTASVIAPNTTIVKKNMVFPLKGSLSVESCAVALCADA